MSPFWQAAVCVLGIFALGFSVSMGLIMFEHPATKKRDRVLLCILFLVAPCLAFLAGRMDAMRGTELLTENDFVLDMRYEIVDQEIQYPDGSFVLAIRNYEGTIKLYRLHILPPSRGFVPRLDRITHEIWYEPGTKKQ